MFNFLFMIHDWIWVGLLPTGPTWSSMKRECIPDETINSMIKWDQRIPYLTAKMRKDFRSENFWQSDDSNWIPAGIWHLICELFFLNYLIVIKLAIYLCVVNSCMKGFCVLLNLNTYLWIKNVAENKVNIATWTNSVMKQGCSKIQIGSI